MEAPVSIARVLAAKDDLLLVEKTNSESVRLHTQSSVNKVLIGKVCCKLGSGNVPMWKVHDLLHIL